MNAVQKLLVPFALILTLVCLLMGLSSGLGVRFGVWDFRMGFNLLKWSAYLTAAPASLVIAHLIWAKLSGHALAGLKSVIVLVACSLIFGVPFVARYEFMKLPTLADATTSFDDPPVFVDLVSARQQTAKNPLQFRGGEAIAKQQKFFPELVTLESARSAIEIIESAANIATELGFDIASIKPEEGRMEATETTFWFRFKDDLVVRARPQKDGLTQVDIRSASRVGKLDGGVNAKRVNVFLERLKREDKR